VVPIDQFAGQNTPLGLAHGTPSIATTVNGAMIVTAYAFASSATWTPPAGMTESFDRASLAVPNVAGISLEANRVYQATAGDRRLTASPATSPTSATRRMSLRPQPERAAGAHWPTSQLICAMACKVVDRDAEWRRGRDNAGFRPL
jgi:hypothetical protein